MNEQPIEKRSDLIPNPDELSNLDIKELEGLALASLIIDDLLVLSHENNENLNQALDKIKEYLQKQE